VTSGTFDLGGYALFLSATTHKVSFTPVLPFDTIDLYYHTFGGNGTFTVDIDGGASLGTINTNQASLFRKTSFSVALGTHTINCNWASGFSVFSGIAVRDTTTPRIEVYNMGAAGSKAIDWQDQGASLVTTGVDAVFINLTINDAVAATSLSAYEASLQTLISSLRAANIDVVLMTGAPSNNANATNGVLDGIIGKLGKLAGANDIPLINICSKWASYAASQPLGYYGDAGVGSLHPSSTGYADIASSVIAALTP
jgi:lysophospholipase L1-like esterase